MGGPPEKTVTIRVIPDPATGEPILADPKVRQAYEAELESQAHTGGLAEAATTIRDWMRPWVDTPSPWAAELRALLKKLGAGDRSAAADAAYAAGEAAAMERVRELAEAAGSGLLQSHERSIAAGYSSSGIPVIDMAEAFRSHLDALATVAKPPGT